MMATRRNSAEEKREGVKRRKIMNTEVFETPDAAEGGFRPYAAANASARQARGGARGPESEGHFFDKSSMELDEEEMAPTKAFEVFMGKVYKPTLPPQSEYEATGTATSAKTLESPLTRFTRLSQELKELESDLTLLAADAERKKQKVVVDAGQQAEFSEVMQGLRTLQLNLAAVEQNADFQPFLRRSGAAGVAVASADAALNLQKDLTAKFFQQIEALKRQQQGQTSVASAGEAPIVYEIYSNGELNAVDRDAKARVATLETRLATLEKAVGDFQGGELRLDGLQTVSGAASADLTAAVAQLEQRVALLSEKSLDAVKTRTTALVHEFTLLSKLKQTPSVKGALNSQAERDQVNEVYEQLSRLDAVVASVPALVDRLVTLKSVHDDALEATQRVDKMEKAQSSLADLLDSDAALLSNMEASLEENVQIFQSNIQQLDERMAKLLAQPGATAGSR